MWLNAPKTAHSPTNNIFAAHPLSLRTVAAASNLDPPRLWPSSGRAVHERRRRVVHAHHQGVGASSFHRDRPLLRRRDAGQGGGVIGLGHTRTVFHAR